GEEGEPGAAAGDDRLGPVEGEVDRVGGERPGDLGQGPAGNEHHTGRPGVQVEGHLRGHLVVEAGELQPVVVGDLQPHAGEHRYRRPGGKTARRPPNGSGEQVRIDLETHVDF